MAQLSSIHSCQLGMSPCVVCAAKSGTMLPSRSTCDRVQTGHTCMPESNVAQADPQGDSQPCPAWAVILLVDISDQQQSAGSSPGHRVHRPYLANTECMSATSTRTVSPLARSEMKAFKGRMGPQQEVQQARTPSEEVSA